jgi:hypothetical protein
MSDSVREGVTDAGEESLIILSRFCACCGKRTC